MMEGEVEGVDAFDIPDAEDTTEEPEGDEGVTCITRVVKAPLEGLGVLEAMKPADQ